MFSSCDGSILNLRRRPATKNFVSLKNLARSSLQLDGDWSARSGKAELSLPLRCGLIGDVSDIVPGHLLRKFDYWAKMTIRAQTTGPKMGIFT